MDIIFDGTTSTSTFSGNPTKPLTKKILDEAIKALTEERLQDKPILPLVNNYYGLRLGQMIGTYSKFKAIRTDTT